MQKLFILGLFIALASSSVILAQTTVDTTTALPSTSDSVTTASTISTHPFTTTTAQTTTTTETTVPTTTPTTTHTTTTPETTTKPDTTTPVPTTTTPKTTTTTPVVTTTPAAADIILNFTVPKNTSVTPCLKVKFSLAFDISYKAQGENSTVNSSQVVHMDSFDDFDGTCDPVYNSLVVSFFSNWSLSLNYTLKNNAFDLETIVLEYFIDDHFKNAVPNDQKQIASVSNLNEFSANKGNSYKCTSETTVKLDNGVSLMFKNYQGQPFASESKSKDFDTAIECAADTTGTNKLVPIIVGSALAVLVVLVLIAYIIGRRKHRPGYQSV